MAIFGSITVLVMMLLIGAVDEPKRQALADGAAAASIDPVPHGVQ